MEELFMAGNDGELSFVESNGNIVLEQGCQSYTPLFESSPSVVNNPSPVKQVSSNVPPQLSDSGCSNTISLNDSNNQQYQSLNSISYSNNCVLQSAQILRSGSQDQGALQRVDEYPVVQEIILPQQQQVLHIIPSQSQIQLQNVVQVPIQQQISVQGGNTSQLNLSQQQISVQGGNAPQLSLSQQQINMQGSNATQLNLSQQQINVQGGSASHINISQHQPQAQYTYVQKVQRLATPRPMQLQNMPPHQGDARNLPKSSQQMRYSFPTSTQNQYQIQVPQSQVNTVVVQSSPGSHNYVHRAQGPANMPQTTLATPPSDSSQMFVPRLPVTHSVRPRHPGPPNMTNNYQIEQHKVNQAPKPVRPRGTKSANVRPKKSNAMSLPKPAHMAMLNTPPTAMSPPQNKLTLNSPPTKVDNAALQQRLQQIKNLEAQVSSSGGNQPNRTGPLKDRAPGQKVSNQTIYEDSGRVIEVKSDSEVKMVTMMPSDVKSGPIVIGGVSRGMGIRRKPIGKQEGVVSGAPQNKMIVVNDSSGQKLILLPQNSQFVRTAISTSNSTSSLQGSSSPLKVTVAGSPQIQQQVMYIKEPPSSQGGSSHITFPVPQSPQKGPLIQGFVSSENGEEKVPIPEATRKDLEEFYTKFPGNAVVRKVAPAKGRGRGRGGRGRGRGYEEPMILTLSSDEDEEGDLKSPTKASNPVLAKAPGVRGVVRRGGVSGRVADLESKEPEIPMEVIGERERTGIIVAGLAPNQSRTMTTNLSLKCRSIRVGSYKVSPVEKIEIRQQDSIRFSIPSLTGDQESVLIVIPFRSILRILGHFGNCLPVLFLYLRTGIAGHIRALLKMTDKAGYYFDPSGPEESHRRVTLLPEKFEDDTRRILRDLLNLQLLMTGGGVGTPKSVNLFHELSQSEANDILIKSSPTEVQSFLKMSSMRSTTEAKTMLIYPPPPAKGGISVTTDDFCCLEEEQFLNDVILDFYLKWLLLNKVSAADRDRTHVFSTFFYKRLTSKPKKGRRPPNAEDDPKLTAAQKRHSRVKSWTKNVDLFSKDFILIPINEHSHWFLAVICFPGLSSPVLASDGTPVPHSAIRRSKKRQPKPKVKVEIPVVENLEWSDRDEAEGDDDELEEGEEGSEDTPQEDQGSQASSQGSQGSQVSSQGSQESQVSSQGSQESQVSSQGSQGSQVSSESVAGSQDTSGLSLGSQETSGLSLGSQESLQMSQVSSQGSQESSDSFHTAPTPSLASQGSLDSTLASVSSQGTLSNSGKESMDVTQSSQESPGFLDSSGCSQETQGPNPSTLVPQGVEGPKILLAPDDANASQKNLGKPPPSKKLKTGLESFPGASEAPKTGSASASNKGNTEASSSFILDKETKIKQPCILIFDSLSGASRCRIVATLRDYLTVEHQQRKNVPKVFNRDSMPGGSPKVPQQMNFSDCGVFTLQFAQNLFEKPLADFRLPIKTLPNWFGQEEVGRKREEIADLIVKIMLYQKPDCDIKVPVLRFNSNMDVDDSSSPERNEEAKGENVSMEVGGDSKEPMTMDGEDSIVSGAVPGQAVDSTKKKKIQINLLNKTPSLTTTDVLVSTVSSAIQSSVSPKEETIMLLPSSSAVIETSGIRDFTKSVVLNSGQANRAVGGCNVSIPSSAGSSLGNPIKSDLSVSQKNVAGKSPGRIEIRDEDTSEVLLIFNPQDSGMEESVDITDPDDLSTGSSSSSPESTMSNTAMSLKFSSSADSAFRQVLPQYSSGSQRPTGAQCKTQNQKRTPYPEFNAVTGFNAPRSQNVTAVVPKPGFSSNMDRTITTKLSSPAASNFRSQSVSPQTGSIRPLYTNSQINTPVAKHVPTSQAPISNSFRNLGQSSNAIRPQLPRSGNGNQFGVFEDSVQRGGQIPTTFKDLQHQPNEINKPANPIRNQHRFPGPPGPRQVSDLEPKSRFEGAHLPLLLQQPMYQPRRGMVSQNSQRMREPKTVSKAPRKRSLAPPRPRQVSQSFPMPRNHIQNMPRQNIPRALIPTNNNVVQTKPSLLSEALTSSNTPEAKVFASSTQSTIEIQRNVAKPNQEHPNPGQVLNTVSDPVVTPVPCVTSTDVPLRTGVTNVSCTTAEADSTGFVASDSLLHRALSNNRSQSLIEASSMLSTTTATPRIESSSTLSSTTVASAIEPSSTLSTMTDTSLMEASSTVSTTTVTSQIEASSMLSTTTVTSTSEAPSASNSSASVVPFVSNASTIPISNSEIPPEYHDQATNKGGLSHFNRLQSLGVEEFTPPIPSRTTSRGRVVNTPKKYLDSDKESLVWKKAPKPPPKGRGGHKS